jgi:hypothetical protein
MKLYLGIETASENEFMEDKDKAKDKSLIYF